MSFEGHLDGRHQSRRPFRPRFRLDQALAEVALCKFLKASDSLKAVVASPPPSTGLGGGGGGGGGGRSKVDHP